MPSFQSSTAWIFGDTCCAALFLMGRKGVGGYDKDVLSSCAEIVPGDTTTLPLPLPLSPSMEMRLVEEVAEWRGPMDVEHKPRVFVNPPAGRLSRTQWPVPAAVCDGCIIRIVSLKNSMVRKAEGRPVQDRPRLGQRASGAGRSTESALDSRRMPQMVCIIDCLSSSDNCHRKVAMPSESYYNEARSRRIIFLELKVDDATFFGDIVQRSRCSCLTPHSDLERFVDKSMAQPEFRQIGSQAYMSPVF